MWCTAFVQAGLITGVVVLSVLAARVILNDWRER